LPKVIDESAILETVYSLNNIILIWILIRL